MQKKQYSRGHGRSNSHGKKNYGHNKNRRGNRGGRNRRSKKADINPALYVAPAKPVQQESIYVESKTYADYNINPHIKKNLAYQKYQHPTKIQDLAIPPALAGQDVLAQARTGSGKTAAFLIPMVQKVLENKGQRCLIILPTRELAQQTQVELGKFAYGTRINSTIVIGGVSVRPQQKQLARNPEFVIATPGRLKDLWQQKIINLADFNNVILDEVDRMLDMGFIHDIKLIVSNLNRNRQSIFVSATMDQKSEQLAKDLLTNPVVVKAESQQAPHANVDQDVVRISNAEGKVDILHNLLIQEEFEKVLIFSRTKYGAQKLSKKLSQRGHKSDAIHGNKSQSQRSRVIDKYRKNQITVLVATDVVARGLDVKDITHVINYDEPGSYEDYIHRIGRTGRIGKTGTALTFVER